MGYEKCLAGFRGLRLDVLRPKNWLQGFDAAKAEHQARVTRWREVEACPVCGAAERRQEFAKFGVDIVCCLACTLRYSARVAADPAEVYGTPDYSAMAKGLDSSRYDYYKKRFGRERIEILRAELGDPAGRSVLDVGCGAGWFLEVARDAGMLAFGQDVSAVHQNRVEHIAGLTIYHCPVAEIEAERRFDAVTLFDVVEHVADPVGLVRECSRLLAPDGIILVFTPNFDSLAVHATREASSNIVPLEHVALFTERSAAALAERAGLALTGLRTAGIDMGDLKSYFELRGEPDMAAACERLYDLVQPAIDAAGAGNHLRFVLRRPR